MTDVPTSTEQLINYQEGSIVSKTLVKKETGNVTLFAFAKGQVLSEHTSPFDAIVFILDGSAQVSINGKKYNLGNGQLLKLPAGEPHGLQALEAFKMMLIMIKN